MEFHPLCMILPEMPAGDYRRLVESIREKGLVRPITTYEDKILDGRHRYRACLDVGRPLRYEPYVGDDPAGFVAASCVHRNLNASQRALIAAGFLEYEKAQARRRQADLNGKTKTVLVEDFPPATADGGKARDKAGERMQVSGRTVDDAAKVLKQAAPEVLEKVRSGKMALNEAKKVVQLNPEAQRRIAAADTKTDRAAEMRIAMNRSDAAKRRHTPAPAIEQPGSAFVRKFLGGLERITLICAEDGAKDASSIAARFLDEMDWNSEALAIQLERCEPVIRALAMIKQHNRAAA